MPFMYINIYDSSLFYAILKSKKLIWKTNEKVGREVTATCFRVVPSARKEENNVDVWIEGMYIT